jgi:hypothetical protein
MAKQQSHKSPPAPKAPQPDSAHEDAERQAKQAYKNETEHVQPGPSKPDALETPPNARRGDTAKAQPRTKSDEGHDLGTAA